MLILPKKEFGLALIILIAITGVSRADNNVVPWRAVEGKDIRWTGKEYCLSEAAYLSFLRIGVDREYAERECQLQIGAKEEQIFYEGERCKENIELEKKTGEEKLAACVASREDVKKNCVETVTDQQTKIEKLQNPPIYKRNSFWYTLGLITATVLFLIL